MIEVQATSGDMHLGGDDWDQRIVDWLLRGFEDEHDIDLSNDRVALQRLVQAAEQAKILLSRETETIIEIPSVATGPGCR